MSRMLPLLPSSAAPLAALLLLAAPLAAFAATPINESRPLDARGTVHVENLKGSIRVRAWERNEVKIEGSLGEGVEKLEIEGDRSRLTVRVRYPKSGGLGVFGDGERTEPTHLRLMVPRHADLGVESVAAGVDVQGLAKGELDVETVSGDVTVIGAPGEASIESVSGDLQLTLNTDKVNTESVSGDIHLRGRLGGEVQMEAVSGDLTFGGHESAVRRFSGNTVSGDMSIGTALADAGRITVETVSGNVTLRMPKNLSARVRGETFSGDLAAPGASVQRPKHGPGANLEHRYGNGDGEITIESFSGDARLVFD